MKRHELEESIVKRVGVDCERRAAHIVMQSVRSGQFRGGFRPARHPPFANGAAATRKPRLFFTRLLQKFGERRGVSPPVRDVRDGYGVFCSALVLAAARRAVSTEMSEMVMVFFAPGAKLQISVNRTRRQQIAVGVSFFRSPKVGALQSHLSHDKCILLKGSFMRPILFRTPFLLFTLFLVWLNPMQGKQVSKRPFMVAPPGCLKLDIDKELRDVEILSDGRVVVLTEDRLVEMLYKHEAQASEFPTQSLESRDDVNKTHWLLALRACKCRTLVDGLDHAAVVSADAKTGDVHRRAWRQSASVHQRPEPARNIRT